MKSEIKTVLFFTDLQFMVNKRKTYIYLYILVISKVEFSSDIFLFMPLNEIFLRFVDISGEICWILSTIFTDF